MQFSATVLLVLITGLFAYSTESLPTKCTRTPIYGRCKLSIQNYYFDVNTNMCKPFTYSGCGGNGNNFPHLIDCIRECRKSVLHAPWLKVIGESSLNHDPPPKCKQPKETGWCKARLPRFYYDTFNKRCTSFIYGGCGGNENNFLSLRKCYQECDEYGTLAIWGNPDLTEASLLDTCKQPLDMGPCKAAYPRFYYDAQTKSCKPFIFGGCQGNKNNFRTQQECLRECSSPG